MPEFNAKVGRLSIRDGVPADRDAVADLFNRAEPEIPLDRAAYAAAWDWLHARNVVQPSDVIVAADEHGALQGHVAMLPVAFERDGATTIAGWPCQLMVDDRQRRGLLYPVMVQQLLQFCRTRGYEFAYALINRPRVLKANIALGLRPIGIVPIWARPYRPARIAGTLVGGRWGRAIASLASPANLLFRIPYRPRRGVDVRAIERFESDIDALFAQTLVPRYRFVARRDAATLNWRFFGLPERGYRVYVASAGGAIRGYVALRMMPMKAFRALAIADLWHDPAFPVAGDALLALVHRLALAEQVDLAACLMPPGSPMAALLRRHWFLESPESFTLTVYQPHRDLPYTGSSLADWHPTWYDHDYV